MLTKDDGYDPMAGVIKTNRWRTHLSKSVTKRYHNYLDRTLRIDAVHCAILCLELAKIADKRYHSYILNVTVVNLVNQDYRSYGLIKTAAKNVRKIQTKRVFLFHSFISSSWKTLLPLTLNTSIYSSHQCSLVEKLRSIKISVTTNYSSDKPE